jgi:hyperosmotically inducible protein
MGDTNMKNRSGFLTALTLALAGLTLAACPSTPPITLIERAIEARGTLDIIDDNRIVIEVNRIMAEIRSVKASTEIYEQRLLITGLFDDKSIHDRFRKRVRAVKGVKKLYWHAAYLSKAEQERREDTLLNWTDAVILDTKIDAKLLATRGVANVNFRTAVDSFGTVYLLGRARSGEERKKALAVARGTKGAKKVVDYVEVRP